jgi:hypothetical protein
MQCQRGNGTLFIALSKEEQNTIYCSVKGGTLFIVVSKGEHYLLQCQRGNTIYFILHRSIFHEQRQENGADFWENFPYEILLLASIWRDLLPILWYIGT